MVRLGLFGGTFDPIHVGHLAVASAASFSLGLDEVLFVVAHSPWQKVGSREISPSPLRLAMVAAAVAPRADFVASSVEIDRGGSSYTIDTVLAVVSERPGVEIVLVVGSDVVDDLDTWHRHDELAKLVTVGVVDRPGADGAVAPPGWVVEEVSAPMVDLSSTMLRRRMAVGAPVDFLVPAAALEVRAEYDEDPDAWLKQNA